MSDAKFFTNAEGDDSLLARFQQTLRGAKYFDVVVGYFRSSGFQSIAQDLENTDRIRILVGIDADSDTVSAVRRSTKLGSSHREIRSDFSQAVRREFGEEAADSKEVEDSGRLFLKWLGDGRLEIRGHPSRAIHAKVYITTYKPDQVLARGSVITGSSNFSQSGFFGRPEFNVELRDGSDFKFAQDWFEKLWAEGVDLGPIFQETVVRDTWLNDEITPYELYLKCLLEYFQDDIDLDEGETGLEPDNYYHLEYQNQAVIQARRILETYNGVFLADVVGLGKTYISALLLRKLEGHKLIIVPPVLMKYWGKVLEDFDVSKFKVVSSGKLAALAGEAHDKYRYVLIDEAHRFRNELTASYDNLKTICQNKKVILVSATPFNNRFADLRNQLLLFQAGRKSAIPGVPNLRNFFDEQDKNLKAAGNGQAEERKEALRKASALIRDKVLKHVLIRRTRSEIAKYFKDDLRSQNLTFPELKAPERLTYEFDLKTERAFNLTVQLLPNLTYARYAPLEYLELEGSGDWPQRRQGQKLLQTFMKILLVKRLESSQFAFKETLKRFIKSLQNFLRAFEDKGAVYMGGRADLEALLAAEDDDLASLLDRKEVEELPADQFKPAFRDHLLNDLAILEEILELWQPLRRDPKREAFIGLLSEFGAEQKILVFTESVETAEHLFESLEEAFPGAALAYSSRGGLVRGRRLAPGEARQLVLHNFDPNDDQPTDDYRFLISTDVLAEGVNLHQAGLILNYDLPWNPTRLMQRVGRINRIGSPHKEIRVFNFWPTSKADSHLGLETNIANKLDAFHAILGEDSRYLSPDEEPAPKGLFGRQVMDGLAAAFESDQDEDSELKYLNLIRQIRDERPELLEKLKKLPPKARSAQTGEKKLLVFFRDAKVKKFVRLQAGQAEEISFLEAAATLECAEATPRAALDRKYYFDNLKRAKDFLAQGDWEEDTAPRGLSNKTNKLLINIRYLQRRPDLTDEDKTYLNLLYKYVEEDRLTITQTGSALKAFSNAVAPDLALARLRSWLPASIFAGASRANESGLQRDETPFEGQRQVILAEYFNPASSGEAQK